MDRRDITQQQAGRIYELGEQKMGPVYQVRET